MHPEWFCARFPDKHLLETPPPISFLLHSASRAQSFTPVELWCLKKGDQTTGSSVELEYVTNVELKDLVQILAQVLMGLHGVYFVFLTLSLPI